MNAIANLLVRTAALALVVAAVSGCQYRYNAYGERIYGWQFGQDNLREVDYTNPRLPILPKWRPNTDLWPTPSPYEFNDLSRWSYLDEQRLPREGEGLLPSANGPAVRSAAGNRVAFAPMRVGDNADCAACSESTARLALLASRADAVDGRRAALAR